MPDMLIAKGFVEKVNEEDGVIEAAIASTSVVDRTGDIIDQSGWDLSNFLKNPQFLWGHNLRDYRPPIGKVEKIWLEGDRLMFRPRFDLKDPFAKELFRKVKEGFLNAFSVGFNPLEIDGNTFTKSELLEISLVAVPANQEALVVLRDGGMKTMGWDDITEEANKSKKVVPFKATPTLPDSASWNANESKRRIKDWAKKTDGDISFAKYRRAFAWFDHENSEKLTSYKLPHHDVRGSELVVNWRAVASAMASLLGARGGVNIPDSEKRGIYNHLKKHYAQYDRPVPEFRYVEDQVLKLLGEEIKHDYEQEYKEYVMYTLRSIKNELKAERRIRKQVKKFKSKKVVKNKK